MDIAAAIVGFVGLSGQALQGCNYLLNFFSDVRDAPEVVVTTSAELCTVRSLLEDFRLLLLEIQATSPASLRVQQDPTVALRSCQAVIHNLQRFVNKYADLSDSTRTNPNRSPISRAAIRKAWHKFDVGRRGGKLRSYVSQLQVAKTSLLATQTNIQLALELQCLGAAREAQRDLRRLLDKYTASIQIVEETKALATNIHTLQEDNLFLTKTMNMSLDQAVSDNQILLTRSALAEQSVHDANVASKLTQETISFLSTSLLEKFNNLPTALAPIIENTIAKSSTKHNASTQAVVVAKSQAPPDFSSNDACSLPLRTSSEKALISSENASSTVYEDASFVPRKAAIRAGNFMQSKTPSRRSPKRQRASLSIFDFWFGRVEIKSSITEQEEDTGSGYTPPMRLQAKWTSITLLPNAQFFSVGLLFEWGHGRPVISSPGCDNRLRVVRTHHRKSPVVHAIQCGDLLRFQQLLELRKASPFDLVEHIFGRPINLFQLVIYQMAAFPYDRDLELHRRMVEIARWLADSDIDCGAGISLGLVLLILDSGKATEDLASTLFRIIMTHSQSNPFDDDNLVHWAAISKSHVSILKQEEWDLTEFRSQFEYYWGSGAFRCLLENQTYLSDWKDLQRQKWHQKPASFRSSRSQCLDEFGWDFVECHWG